MEGVFDLDRFPPPQPLTHLYIVNSNLASYLYFPFELPYPSNPSVNSNLASNMYIVLSY